MQASPMLLYIHACVCMWFSFLRCSWDSHSTPYPALPGEVGLLGVVDAVIGNNFQAFSPPLNPVRGYQLPGSTLLYQNGKPGDVCRFSPGDHKSSHGRGAAELPEKFLSSYHEELAQYQHHHPNHDSEGVQSRNPTNACMR